MAKQATGAAGAAKAGSVPKPGQDNCVQHPERAGMGQRLAGRGNLVFEGELVDTPQTWKPDPTNRKK